jgi:hypothetical protein
MSTAIVLLVHAASVPVDVIPVERPTLTDHILRHLNVVGVCVGARCRHDFAPGDGLQVGVQKHLGLSALFKRHFHYNLTVIVSKKK